MRRAEAAGGSGAVEVVVARKSWIVLGSGPGPGRVRGGAAGDLGRGAGKGSDNGNGKGSGAAAAAVGWLSKRTRCGDLPADIAVLVGGKSFECVSRA